MLGSAERGSESPQLRARLDRSREICYNNPKQAIAKRSNGGGKFTPYGGGR